MEWLTINPRQMKPKLSHWTQRHPIVHATLEENTGCVYNRDEFLIQYSDIYDMRVKAALFDLKRIVSWLNDKNKSIKQNIIEIDRYKQKFKVPKIFFFL